MMEKAEEPIDLDAHLLQALNGFILLIGDNPHRQEESSKTNGSGQSDTKVDAKMIANYLRLTLLSYLRQLQSQSSVCPYREALIQWWVTLLNFLNSDLINRNNSQEGVAFQDPLLTVDSISVSLECISRLITSLMILPSHDCKDTEIYSHHILLTIHYVTTRLILNSKHQREFTRQQLQRPELPRNQQVFNKSVLHFLNGYTSLLRSFLGKLNAYAFFFLPDDFHYDTQLLFALKPNLSYEQTNSLFLWKRRSFGTAEKREDRIKPELLENRDTKFFKIVISYMKNDFIFMAFYWHYWYVVLRFLSHLNGGSDLEVHLSMIPGANVLITHATNGFLRIDFIRFINFLQSNNGNGIGIGPSRADQSNLSSAAKGPGILSPMVNVNANVNASAGTSIGEGTVITAEALNDFLFTNFRILRVWECLRDLSGCLERDFNVPVLLSLHDSSQLRYISSVPAHDSGVANIIYNKVFQFIIFQFRSLPSIQFLHWDIWLAGVSSMLQTLNSNAQAVALLFLFNVWPYIPIDLQSMLSQQLINVHWDSLGVDTDFQLIKVLFLKVLVFRIVPNSGLAIREQLRFRFQNFYTEMLMLRLKIKEEPLRDKEDELYFYGSKRFFLVPNRLLKERDLICRAEKYSPLKYGARYRNFPTVSSVANLRPILVLKNGRYPYDVFDEMVARASLLIIDRKKKELQMLPTINSSPSISRPDTQEARQKPSSSMKISSFSTTINSWISKLSKASDQAKPSKAEMVEIQSDAPLSNDVFMKGGKNSDFIGEETVPLSESLEMLSMYSNLSSIATKCASSEISQTNVAGPPTNFRPDVFGYKETHSNFYNNRRRKKLLPPAELKYSSSIVDTGEICTLFKVILAQAEPIGKKVERANSGWGVVTAKTYNKPLPVPYSPSRESNSTNSVIDELNNDSFGIDCLNESSLESFMSLEDGAYKANESASMSDKSDALTLPKPNCGFFGIQNAEDSNVSTDDSDLLNRFQNLALGETDLQENEGSILKGIEGSNGDVILSRRRALYYNRYNLLKTRLNKLSRIIRMFNKTVEEYYNYLNFLNHESIFMDFEIRPPAHSNSIGPSGD